MRTVFTCVAAAVGLVLCTMYAEAAEGNAFRQAMAHKAEKALADGKFALDGTDGWKFLTAELHHLGAGPFWGGHAARVSRATRKDAADPLPAIVDFHEQLAGAGIELVLLPVPAKAAIYPEKTAVGVPPPAKRICAAHFEFYGLLRKEGVRVVDLGPIFARARVEREEPPLYCLTDSHWSGRGCVLAARTLADALKTPPPVARKHTYRGEWRDTTIHGDLTGLAGEDGRTETVRLRYVADEAGKAPGDWRESPVVLLGDSHTLVFHAGSDMHGNGAGLADQLALELGYPVDVVGVRGSGATPARINLLRRRDNMAGKKLVIWCFSVREFTEAAGGWRRVPVIR